MSTLLAQLIVLLMALGEALVVVSAFVVPAVQQPPTERAWIDTPLSGSRLPRDPVGVLGHATDPDGVAHLELVVDGAIVAVERPRRAESGAARAPVLASARLVWRAATPGRHVLVVTGLDPGGERGFPAQVVIEVERERPTPHRTPRPTNRPRPRTTPRPTPRATARPTPRPTQRPTPRPCVPPRPVPESPPDFYLVDTPAGNPPTLRWDYAREPDCEPTGYLVRVVDDDGAVVLQRRLRGDVRSFTPSRELANCRVYEWTVRAIGAGGRSRPSRSRSFAISYRCS